MGCEMWLYLMWCSASCTSLVKLALARRSSGRGRLRPWTRTRYKKRLLVMLEIEIEIRCDLKYMFVPQREIIPKIVKKNTIYI